MNPNPGCPAIKMQMHLEQNNVASVPDGPGIAGWPAPANSGIFFLIFLQLGLLL